MSVADLLTPLSSGKAWSNIEVNSINTNSINTKTINIETGGSNFQGPITITENSASGSPIVDIIETNTAANNINVALKSSNQSGTAGVKIVTQNDPSPSGNIWGDGNFSISTFQPSSFIALNPNNSLNALTCQFISPGQTVTNIQNIKLPTTGGIASNLNYYEEFSALFGFSGPWGVTTYTRNVNIIRIGRIVLLKIDSILQAQNTNTTIMMTGNIPARFIPTPTADSSLSDFQVTLFDNGNYVNGSLRISGTGGIQIFFMKYTGTAPFFYTNSTGLGSCGFNELFISYLI